MSGFDGWLKSISVLYVGDPKSAQLGWLAAAGARVIKAENTEEARAATQLTTPTRSMPPCWTRIGPAWDGLDSHVTCRVLRDRRVERQTGSLAARQHPCGARGVPLALGGRSRLPVPLEDGDQAVGAEHAPAGGEREQAVEPARQLSRLLYYNLWSYSDQEIADAMGLSRHTIQEYQDELRRRTGVRTKHAYLRRLLEYAGEEPPLSMSDTTRAHVTQFRRRLENGGLHS